MRSDRILPDFRAIVGRTSRSDADGPSSRFPFRWSRWIGWRQWLVLFSMGATVIIIEVRNHAHMWQEHQSGQTLWTDQELIWEIVLFGLVLPILGGVVLGYMSRMAIERDEISRELELRRVLVDQMNEAQSWQELAELVVTTPGSVVSADRAWLLAQRSGEEEFDQISHWESPVSKRLPPARTVTPAVCERCESATTLEGSRILTCHSPYSESNNHSSTRYCLWLSSENTGKAALLFDMPVDQRLSLAQMKLLDDFGDEMSLAISHANLQHVKQRQVDAAKNERLRIARELHDTLGQNISYLRLKLEQLSTARLISGRSEFQDELASMLVVAQEAYEQVRDTLEELRTTEHRDLEETIRIYAAKAAQRTGFSVNIHSSGQPRPLSTRRNRQIMYIVREALNNIEKHASAQNVDIHLQWSEVEFNLIISDDGQGFNPKDLKVEDHYGMAIMGERSRAINANLAVESTPGEGTVLTLSLSLSSEATKTSKNQ